MNVRRWGKIGALALALTLSSIADARVTNKYSRWGFGKPYGYKDKIVTKDRWEVRGLGTHAGPGYMEALVFRRAATLAKANGFDYFYVVGAGFSCSSSPFAYSPGGSGPGVCDNVLSQSAILVSVGISSADSKAPCEGRNKESCRSYSVKDVVEGTNGFFGITSEHFASDVAEVQARQR